MLTQGNNITQLQFNLGSLHRIRRGERDSDRRTHQMFARIDHLQRQPLAQTPTDTLTLSDSNARAHAHQVKTFQAGATASLQGAEEACMALEEAYYSTVMPEVDGPGAKLYQYHTYARARKDTLSGARLYQRLYQSQTCSHGTD